MRRWIVSGAVVLGLGVMGVTLAQHNGDQNAHIGGASNNQVPDKPEPRAQVAKLRAEVELLELEHEADKEVLVALLKEERISESESGRDDKARQAVREATMLAARLGKLERIQEGVRRRAGITGRSREGVEAEGRERSSRGRP